MYVITLPVLVLPARNTVVASGAKQSSLDWREARLMEKPLQDC
jgi:hypothetical protein